MHRNKNGNGLFDLSEFFSPQNYSLWCLEHGVCNSYMAFQKLLVVTSRQSLTNLDPIWWWIFRKTVVRNVEPTPTHQPTPTTRQGAGRERPTNGTSTPGAGDVCQKIVACTYKHWTYENMCIYVKNNHSHTSPTVHLFGVTGLPYKNNTKRCIYVFYCFFIFGVVLGARHKFATTGKLRVVTIVYAKVEVGIINGGSWFP